MKELQLADRAVATVQGSSLEHESVLSVDCFLPFPFPTMILGHLRVMCLYFNFAFAVNQMKKIALELIFSPFDDESFLTPRIWLYVYVNAHIGLGFNDERYEKNN